MLIVMVPILINKDVFEPTYNDLKFMGVTSTEMYWPGTFVYPFVESGKKSKGFRYFVWLWV